MFLTSGFIFILLVFILEVIWIKRKTNKSFIDIIKIDRTAFIYIISSSVLSAHANHVLLSTPLNSSDYLISFNQLPLWISVAILLIGFDFVIYWMHFLFHKNKILWELHKVHHSVRSVRALSTFQSHLIAQLLMKWAAPLIFLLIGIDPLRVSLAMGIFSCWAIFIHADLNLTLHKLNWILVTPDLHRIHHLEQTSNRNFGTVFSFWDRIFGYFTSEAIELTPRTRKGLQEKSWLAQFVDPIRAIEKIILKA